MCSSKPANLSLGFITSQPSISLEERKQMSEHLSKRDRSLYVFVSNVYFAVNDNVFNKIETDLENHLNIFKSHLSKVVFAL